MSDHSIAISSPSFSPAAATTPVPNRPVAARTRLLLEGPVLSTLLRLSAPNVLNLLAIAGMITFDALFLGRLGADALVHHTFLLALALAALFSTTFLLGAPYVFRWMGGKGEVLSAALSYANVAFSGAISICMLNLLGGAVRGTGNMTLPSAVIGSSVLAHILLSPLLIFGWGPVPALGPAGAGWGLTLSFGAGSLVLITYLRSSRS